MKRTSLTIRIVCIILLVLSVVYLRDLPELIRSYTEHKRSFETYQAKNNNFLSSRARTVRERELQEIVTEVLPYDNPDVRIEIRVKNPERAKSGDLHIIPANDDDILLDIKKI